jgi:hypothetical protein
MCVCLDHRGLLQYLLCYITNSTNEKTSYAQSFSSIAFVGLRFDIGNWGKRGRNERFDLVLSSLSLYGAFKVSNQDRELVPNRESCRHSPAVPAAVPSKWETRHEGGMYEHPAAG